MEQGSCFGRFEALLQLKTKQRKPRDFLCYVDFSILSIGENPVVNFDQIFTDQFRIQG